MAHYEEGINHICLKELAYFGTCMYNNYEPHHDKTDYSLYANNKACTSMQSDQCICYLLPT